MAAKLKYAEMKTEMNTTTQKLPRGAMGFSKFLRTSFLAKTQKNPRYSLRSFAAFLGIDQSHLSKVIKGKKFLSEDRMTEILLKLQMSPGEIADLLHGKRSSSTPLEEEAYALIADWLHFALLEYLKIKTNNHGVPWMARRFEVHHERVRDCLERLERLGFIVYRKSGEIELVKANNTCAEFSFSTQAKKQLQQSYLQLSSEAVDAVPFPEREHCAHTLAIDKKNLAKFKRRLNEVREMLAEEFQAGGNFNEVYQMTFSLFPLTRDRQEN